MRAHNFVTLAVAATTIACTSVGNSNGNSGGSSSSSSSITLDEFLAKVEQAECHADQTCGRAYISSEAACLRWESEANRTWPVRSAEVKAGAAKFDASKAQACLDASSKCDGDRDAACQAVIVGTVADGGACSSSNVCLADSGCDGCKCAPRSGVGGSCASQGDCQLNAYCAGGKCVANPPRPKLGEICQFDTKGGSAYFRCADGTRCVSSKCAPFVAAGGVCGNSFDCAAGLSCTPKLQNGDPGTCKPAPALGGSCEDVDCPYSDWKCVGEPGKRTCVPLSFYGEACVDGQCHYVDECDATSKKCVATSTASWACAGDSDCSQNFKCRQGMCTLSTSCP